MIVEKVEGNGFTQYRIFENGKQVGFINSDEIKVCGRKLELYFEGAHIVGLDMNVFDCTQIFEEGD